MELSENYSCVDCIWHDQCESDVPCDFFDTGRSGGEQIAADFQPVFVQEIDRRLLQVLPEDEAAFAPAYICKC